MNGGGAGETDKKRGDGRSLHAAQAADDDDGKAEQDDGDADAGLHRIFGAVNAPPSAARNTPRVKANANARVTLTPMARLIRDMDDREDDLPVMVRLSPNQSNRPATNARPTKAKS